MTEEQGEWDCICCGPGGDKNTIKMNITNSNLTFKNNKRTTLAFCVTCAFDVSKYMDSPWSDGSIENDRSDSWENRE